MRRGEEGALRGASKSGSPGALKLGERANIAHAHVFADLEWRLIYVGSATGEEYDQELDSCMGESGAR